MGEKIHGQRCKFHRMLYVVCKCLIKSSTHFTPFPSNEKDYEFGDITKKALSSITGKDDYQFGDLSKKVMGDLFGKRKRGGK